MRRIIVSALILATILSCAMAGQNQVYAEIYTSDISKPDYKENTYNDYLNAHGFNGIMASSDISVDINKFTLEGDIEAYVDDEGVIVTGDGSITWGFAAPENGFYNIELTYMPVQGTNSKIERRIYINGEIPYRGLSQILLSRTFDNTNGEEIRMRNGNEIRPLSQEVFEWNSVYINDSQKKTINPYIVYLSKGTHTITFETVKEPLKIGALSFNAAELTQPYSEVIASLEADYEIYDGEIITYQAERITENTMAVLKSSQAIGNLTDYTDPNTVPFHPYRIRLNTIGGINWRSPAEKISWVIDVPKDGLYAISFRARQNTNRGVMSFRRLYVNGQTPFTEAEKLGFVYNTNFSNYTIARNGEPCLIQLNEGRNTISLEIILGDYAEIFSVVEESLAELNTIYRMTVQLTGVVPDRFIDYEINLKIPEFKPTLAKVADVLTEAVENLVEISGEKSERTVMIERMAVQAHRLAEDPERVVNEIDAFKSNISALGDWLISVSDMPLEIDSFSLHSPDTVPPRAAAGFFRKFGNEIIRFLATFFVDETRLVDADEGITRDALTVWVPTGRDQAQILKNLIDESFTPSTNIPINLQLIPIGVALPATLSGAGPDIIVDMSAGDAMNFGIRNALVDFSEMPDFAEVSANFYDSAFETVTFQGSIYGLPEKQWFPMMYVRQDILEQLEIEVPRTWDEMERAIMALNIHGYDAWLPGVSFYSSLVYQYGGDMYIGEGDDYGIASGLYDENAMLAFMKLTELYTAYKVPVMADFPSRFRTGEMPIGIADYTLFNTLELYAPEIRGLWSFYPVPGVVEEDGNINNASVCVTNVSVLLNSCNNKEDAWEFLKWWISDEVQTTYALSLEAILGTAGRYPTANRNVLEQLPWTNNAASQLALQLENTVGIQSVPGSYMTDRMVDYAFKSVVTNSNALSPREALYLNVKSINRELTRKREEFRLSTVDTRR